MGRLPEFLTGSRYVASDSLKPSWLAHYDISTFALFSDPRYTSLRTNRSPREAGVVAHLETLDRRTCRVLTDSGPQYSVEEGKAAPFIVTVASDQPVDLAPLEELASCKRVYTSQVEDSLLTSFGHPPRPNAAPKHIATLGPSAHLHSLGPLCLTGHRAQSSLTPPTQTKPSSRIFYRLAVKSGNGPCTAPGPTRLPGLDLVESGYAATR